MSDYKYRYQAVRGLERRKPLGSHPWESITGAILETMTADELRECADAMDAREDRVEAAEAEIVRAALRKGGTGDG